MGCDQSSLTSQQKNLVAKLPKMSHQTLKLYIDNEKAIDRAEKEDPQLLSQLEMKQEALGKIEHNLERLQKQYADLTAQVEKEKQDVDQLETSDLKTYLLERGEFDALISKENEEYLQILQQQEIVQQELDAATGQQLQLSDEVQKLHVKSQLLRDLLTKQDSLLADLFGGEYGSPLENHLEQKLDSLQEQKTRITEASIRWRQAQLMMEFACRQLCVSVQKWRDLSQTPSTDKELRFAIAASTRDNLVAAIQNIEGCQRYLSHIQFPYCTQDEVHTLSRATGYVFTDMQTPERHQHALQCYDATHKRAAALLQWLDQVLETTIRVDLSEISTLVRDTSRELRQERSRLIQDKAREVWGDGVLEGLRGVEVEGDAGEEQPDEDVTEIMSERVSEVEIVKTGDVNEQYRGEESVPEISAADMAPLPNADSIFGEKYGKLKAELATMTDQHERQLDQMRNGRNRQAARVQQDLEMKLNARRKNRAMRNIEAKEKLYLSTET